MKSPLVDALRLAGGQDKAANSEQAQPETEAEATLPIDAAPAPEPRPTLLDKGDAPELSLMDATGVLVVQSAEEADDEFSTSQVIAEEAVNEAVTESVDAEGAAAPLVAAEPAVAVAVKSSGHRPVLARLGLFSPLLCLLLASAATASYFLYQNAGGSLQGTGIGMLTPEPGAGNSAGAVQATGGPVNLFPLVADGRQSRAIKRPSQKLQAIAPAAVVPIERTPLVTSVRSSIDDRAFAVLGEAYAAYASGDFGAAEAAYRRALEIAPRHPNALHGLAAILQRTGRTEDALDYYEVLLSIEPNNTEAAAALLAKRTDTGSFATESEIKVLLQQHPGSAHLHSALGIVMARQDRWADARLAYYKALAIEPKNAEYQFNLAVSLENLGQYEDARARYKAALANVTDASAIDSQLVAARISILTERSANPGTVQ